MILPVHARLREHIAQVLSQLYGLEPAAFRSIVVESPPNRDLGDLGTPLAFELARRLRKAPRAIAAEIAGALASVPGVRQVVAAPNGYLNFFLDRSAFLRERLTPGSFPVARKDGKAIVEHTAINPNKAAHIGHLRNTVLADTVVRLLRYGGVPVEDYRLRPEPSEG